MEQTSPKNIWRALLTFLIIGFSVTAISAGGWLYYSSRLRDVPPLPARAPQTVRAVARIIATPQPSTTPSTNPASEPASAPSVVPQRPVFHLQERHQVEGFREDLKKKILEELAPSFPELQTVLNEREDNARTLPYERVVFQLLDAEKNAPLDRQPAILFAADLAASHLGCDVRDARDMTTGDCARVRSNLARYNLTLAYDELGVGPYYPHDLLWRIWRDYPETEWGERVFVLLLDSGWDTSVTCAKGGDQTREVIRQGESFLEKRPGSPYRGFVTLFVAEAYASRWSLSNEPAGSGMSDYVDPKEFQEGAEAARTKAIGYFEKVLQLAPGTDISRFALEVLPPLRDRQILDNYRFYCVYD